MLLVFYGSLGGVVAAKIISRRPFMRKEDLLPLLAHTSHKYLFAISPNMAHLVSMEDVPLLDYMYTHHMGPY